MRIWLEVVRSLVAVLSLTLAVILFFLAPRPIPLHLYKRALGEIQWALLVRSSSETDGYPYVWRYGNYRTQMECALHIEEALRTSKNSLAFNCVEVER